MTSMNDINIFFNQIRRDGGAVWVENDSIRLSTSTALQNDGTKNFVLAHKQEITAILTGNKIFSKEQFLKTLIFKDHISARYPLSPAQERLWFIEQYEQGSHAFHIPLVFEFGANMNRTAVKYALRQVVLRHEVLRSTIEQHAGQEHAVQRVHDAPLPVDEVQLPDMRSYQSLIKEDINRPFQLGTSYPVRAKIYTVKGKKTTTGHSAARIFLLVNFHHIAADGWSIEIFEKELLACYDAFVKKQQHFRLPGLEIQYKDYALWQRAFLAGPVLEQQLQYWTTRLRNYQVLELPTDFVRPATIDYRGAHTDFTIGSRVSRKLRALARQYGATMHSVMLSCVNILLYKYTGQDDMVLGSPVANRHHGQTEGLIGFFVNLQANRTRLSNTQSFAELLQQVHQDQIQAQQHQDLPFEQLVNALGISRDASRHPLFQVMLSMQRLGSHRRRQQPHTLRPVHTEGLYPVEQFDVSFLIDDSNEQLTGQISYATSLFRHDTMQRLMHYFTCLLEQLSVAPHEPYGHISLLQPEAYHQVLKQWSSVSRSRPLQTDTVCSLFAAQAEKSPGNIALRFEGGQLNYRQLHAHSNRLARHIRSQYLKRTKKELLPDTLIALCVNRSPEMVIGMLAILKAGGAYVPIAADQPQERIDYLLRDTGAELILTQRPSGAALHAQLPEARLIYIDLNERLYRNTDPSNLPPYSSVTNLAYVIYTSGTTGKPTGVAVEHRALASLISAQAKLPGIGSTSVMLQYAAIIFDASVWEIFTALSFGAQLAIVPERLRRDGPLLCQYMNDNGITIALLPPALLNALPHTILPKLKTLLTGGDVCAPETMQLWSQGRTFMNAYGPTEATVMATMHTWQYGDKHTNIGRPIANSKVYVLDANAIPVPTGVTGELYISGAGVARGYLNNKRLTEERFFSNPFATSTDRKKGHDRLYKTGDLVRWLPDGHLEYLGRADDQAKIRGFRIEPGEVEHALCTIPGISQSCVVVKTQNTGAGHNKYLAGYYIWHAGAQRLSPTEIADQLRSRLPEYMVPATLVEMPCFPLTANGKLDKRALPEPDVGTAAPSRKAPANEVERKLCAIWEKVLGRKQVGTTDDFFAMGGNSISAIQAAYLMGTVPGFEVKVAHIFRLKTIGRIIALGHQQLELVHPYHPAQQENLPHLFFIHPGHGGAEVYQSLAGLLMNSYYCIGVDNYNRSHQNKIASLHQLAQLYLSKIEDRYGLHEPVTLLGWSLGGNIALEMAAILEARAYKKITVYLLDTYAGVLRETEPVRLKSGQRSATAAPGYAENFDIEMALFHSPLSRYLQSTKLILFNAGQQTAYGLSDKKSRRGKSTVPVNNIHLAAAHLDIVNLDAQHLTILDTHSVTIAERMLADYNKQR